MLPSKIKDHISRHKTVYLVGSHVAVAGVVFLVTRRLRFTHVEGTNVLFNKANVKNGGTLYHVFNIYGDGFKNRGPSWMVRCVENNRLYRSQKHAAKVLGLDASSVSRHLNNSPHFENVHGYHFERIGIAA